MREPISSAEIDSNAIDRNVQRHVDSAIEHGYAMKPTHETLACACGYEGKPEVIIQYSAWDETDYEWDMFVCPNCGDA